jgi:hypothetical protein
MSMNNTAPIPCDHIVATEFEGSEGVLVDLNAKRYYQLNATAMFIWQCLEKGQSVSEIVSGLTENYEVTSEHAEASIVRLILDLETRKLIRTK